MWRSGRTRRIAAEETNRYSIPHHNPGPSHRRRRQHHAHQVDELDTSNTGAGNPPNTPRPNPDHHLRRHTRTGPRDATDPPPLPGHHSTKPTPQAATTRTGIGLRFWVNTRWVSSGGSGSSSAATPTPSPSVEADGVVARSWDHSDWRMTSVASSAARLRRGRLFQVSRSISLDTSRSSRK